MATTVHEVSTRGFGSNADEYHKARPGYSPEAATLLLQNVGLLDAAGKHVPGTKILDLAAGTGKFTLALLQLLPTDAIVAVEPSAAMREVFHQALPAIPILEGTADKIPLADGAVHAVSVAQAFHWFSSIAALREIRRVLGSHGRLALIWNTRAAEVDGSWLAGLEAIINAYYPPDVPRQQSGLWKNVFAEQTDLFGPLSHADLPYVQLCSPESLAQRVLSISVINSLPAEEKEHVHQKVMDFLSKRPELAGKATLEVEHHTEIYWTERL